MIEPHHIPHPNWTESEDKRSAITWLPNNFPGGCKKNTKKNFAAIECSDTIVIGCYFSLNQPLDEFKLTLKSLDRIVRRLAGKPVMVMEDFNTGSTLWGSNRTNARGERVEKWTTNLSLHLINISGVSTYIRWQGESIIDLI